MVLTFLSEKEERTLLTCHYPYDETVADKGDGHYQGEGRGPGHVQVRPRLLVLQLTCVGGKNVRHIKCHVEIHFHFYLVQYFLRTFHILFIALMRPQNS